MTIEQLRESGWIIYEVLSGSHAYGTNIEGSDEDIRGVYIQPTEDIFSNYIPQVSDEKNDTIFYEIGRFIELLSAGNPNILEILFSPEDCIIYKSEVFDYYLGDKEMFLTKKIFHTFIGFAYSQIQKSKGLNKKINWDESNMVRKDPLDFCYVIVDKEQSVLFRNSKFSEYWKEEDMGLAKVNNAKDLYSIYLIPGKGKGGIISENSNDVQLRSIPIEALFLGYMSFSRDSYSQHCKHYKEYQEWLEKRNKVRYDHIKKHGQKYDGKNIMHTIRILNMGKDLLDDKGLIVRRPLEEVQALINIRKGKIYLEKIYNDAKVYLSLLNGEVKNSKLPSEINREYVNNLITKIRIDNLIKMTKIQEDLKRKELLEEIAKLQEDEYVTQNKYTKYLFIILEVQDGEHCHIHKVLTTTYCKNIDFAAQYYAAHYWGYSSNIGSKNHPKWEVNEGYPIIEVKKVEQLQGYEYNRLNELFNY